jgi:uncharacterized protein YceK
MKRARRVVVLALSAALSGGCGTIMNLTSGDPEIYGGPRKDIEALQTPPSGPTARCPQGNASEEEGKTEAFLAGFIVADIAVSAVADTLTLPLTIYLRQRDSAAH